MKRLLIALSFFIFHSSFSSIAAQQHRPIDNEHPLWMIHIDVWNAADPQKIIDLVPDDIKPWAKPASGSHGSFHLRRENVVDGISIINADGTKYTVVYYLNGHRFNSHTALKKGIYIKNGKKMIVK